jgi:hypothetical protein
MALHGSFCLMDIGFFRHLRVCFLFFQLFSSPDAKKRKLVPTTCSVLSKDDKYEDTGKSQVILHLNAFHWISYNELLHTFTTDKII